MSNTQALLNVTQKNSLRTEETLKKYIRFLKKTKKQKCIYCQKELFVKEFKYWLILENRFPYDKIAKISHMLAPKRHVSGEKNLTINELEELREIKEKKIKKYDAILESTPNSTTRPDHYHLHLLKYYPQ